MFNEDQLVDRIVQYYINPENIGFMVNPKKDTTTLHDIVHYCWTAYDKATKASGPQYIGRQDEEALKEAREKIGKMAEGDTLHKPDAKGNVLSLDKWCLVVNDCWLLGGVHRKATFELTSPLTSLNLWDAQNRIGLQHLTVMGRELVGLIIFDYEVEKLDKVPNPRYRFLAAGSNPDRADFEEYHTEIALLESVGSAAADRLIAVVQSLDQSQPEPVAAGDWPKVGNPVIKPRTPEQRSAILAQWKAQKK